MRPLFTVAIAAYNVEEYISSCFRSIDWQSVDTSTIEFIIVNDGSTDATLQLASLWADGKPNVRIIDKSNGGVASARQAALDNATGIWFTSVDPDDILDKNYFAEVESFLRKNTTNRIDMIITNIISINDKNGRMTNNHALKKRFFEGNRLASLNEEPSIIQLGATAFLGTDLIRKNRLEYSSNVRPTFEDGHFIGRYLSSIASPQLAIVAKAKYYYRKRSDSSSLVQSSWQNLDKYSTIIKHGYINLCQFAINVRGEVPKWVQFMVLYDIFWYFIEDRKQFARTAWLDHESQKYFITLLDQLFVYIDDAVIADFDLYDVPDDIVLSILVNFKNTNNPHAILERTNSGDTDPGYRNIYVSPSHVHEIVEKSVCNTQILDYFGHSFACKLGIPSSEIDELALYVRELNSKASKVSANLVSEVDQRIELSLLSILGVSFLHKVRRFFEIVSIRSLATRSSPLKIVSSIIYSTLQKGVRLIQARINSQRRVRLLSLARNISNSAHFDSAWCILDRPNQADDNGEHLYRYLSKNRLDINAFFILKRNSPDWTRLEREGFRLLDYDSDQAALAVLNSAYIISSDAVAECMYPVHRALVRKSSSKFVFLQHGVLMNDLSRWLNPKLIDLMIVSTKAEYDNVTGIESTYSIAPNRVVQTGLARWDSLVASRIQVEPDARDFVIIMPTWRHYLKSISDAEFLETEYFRNWYSLVFSEAFASFLHDSSSKAIFIPHPSMTKAIESLQFPDHIEVLNRSEVSLQKSLARARLLITDYSSIAFDLAYIDCPTIYYQFDYDTIFGGSHNFRPGYFEYSTNGFGPVCLDLESTLNVIGSELRCPTILNDYRNRFYEAFPSADTSNCSRIVAAIESV